MEYIYYNIKETLNMEVDLRIFGLGVSLARLV